jgi:superfamily II DNA or RNA helicase
MRRLGGNAFILVHKEPLRDQWIENAKKVFPGVKIGLVQGDVCEYYGKDIVIGMVQTIMSNPKRLPYDFYRHFRTVVVDEVHRFGAKAFGSVAPLFNAKYMVGLSGTVRRKDKCENVFKWVIGDTIVKASEVNRVKPIVYIRETGFKAVRTEKFNMDEFQKPTLMNLLAVSKTRNHLIAQDIIKSLKAGRSPLVMSERLDMLEKIAEFVYGLGQSDLGKSISQGMYIGGKSKEELDKAAACEVVYATSQLAQEGIDIPRLDTLFLTTAMSDPEQAIGRVTRNVPGKKQPMVVDYLDSDLKKLVGIFHSRVKLYKKLGWQIIGMRLG